MSEAFLPLGRFHRPLSWAARLTQATRVEEVVAMAREYLASWRPHDLRLLPSECLPPVLDSAEDITEFARLLAVRQFDPPDRSPGLDRMAAFFVKASWRIAQITGAMLAGVPTQRRVSQVASRR